MAQAKKNDLTVVKKSYDLVEEKFANITDGVLPKDFNKGRFLQNCMYVMKNNSKNVNMCNPMDVANVLLNGASLGLDFYRGECYLIAYKGVATFQTDYKGETKLCMKYSTRPIKNIYAKVVRKGDYFKETVKDGIQSVDFEKLPFNNGKIIGVFAVVNYVDGGMSCESMSLEEVEEVRNEYAKMKDSSAWTKSYGEMCKKTVLRRLCKHIDLDFDSVEMEHAFQEASDFDVKTEQKEEAKEETPQIVDIVIDEEEVEVVEAEVVEEEEMPDVPQFK